MLLQGWIALARGYHAGHVTGRTTATSTSRLVACSVMQHAFPMPERAPRYFLAAFAKAMIERVHLWRSYLPMVVYRPYFQLTVIQLHLVFIKSIINSS